MNHTNSIQLIFETLKYKKQFKLLILNFFWFLLIVPWSNATDTLVNIVDIINYILIILLTFWTYNTIYIKVSRYLPVRVKLLFKEITKYIIIYIFLIVLQLVINPHTTSLVSVRQYIVTVIISISLVLLSGYYTFGSRKRQLTLLRTFFSIIFALIIFSELTEPELGGRDIEITNEVKRDIGVLGQSNIYGYYLSLLFIISMAGLSNHIKFISNKIYYIPILIISFLLILKTGSYGAITLALFCSILFLINTTSIKKIIGMYVIIPVISIIIFIAMNIASFGKQNYKSKAIMRSLSEQSITSIYEASTFLPRQERYITGIEKVFENPIFGYGMSAGSTHRLKNFKTGVIHNAFIIHAIKAGIFSGIVILLLYLRLMKYSIQIKDNNTRKMVYSLLFFMFISDNLTTGFNFLSVTHGTVAFSIVLIYLINDLIFKSSSFIPDC